MQNSVSNLLIKAFSLLAILLLIAGGVLSIASHIGYVQNKEASVITIVFSIVIAIIALLLVNLTLLLKERELKEAADVAHQISQGGIFEDETDSDLLESLREISAYHQEKAEAAELIATGDLSITTEPRSDSDALGYAFKKMIERLRLIVQTEESRGKRQESILTLLAQVSEVSAGDLTVQADVGPEITGEIAVAFNSMTRSLRSLIRQIKDVTIQVGASAAAISETTEQLSRGSVAQASQVARTTAAISNMAFQIQEVSENASTSAKVAADSLENARYGMRAAKDNIGAMNAIRKQVQETAKRIKRLGERAQEISQITGLIDDLSDRTSLLALNASLQATAGGTTGSGFEVVAEEVERLAERSNRLTQQISSLTQTINAETKEVVASMEETIQEVIVGSNLADRAGQSLVEIENVSSKLAELLRTISESARFQAKSSEDISNAMSGISEVTELVQSGTGRAADSVRLLVRLSEELRASVAPFKLPADMSQSKALPSNDLNMFVN
ncbi:MAG: methyl-accepting chemotaxis protein [Blastocatellia bacterium]